MISGGGSVFTGGSGIVALSGNNTYTGETTVGGNTLAVRHNKALGTADNTETTGTRITDSNGRVQLENGVTVMDELLTSSPNINLNLYSTGTGAAGALTNTNKWTGDLDSGGTSSNYYTYLRANSTNNRLIVDGEILAQTGPFGYYVYVQGSSSGVVEVNGDVQEPYRFQVQSSTAEVNGSVTTTLGPYVSSGSSTRLSGTGTFSWTSTSQKAEIYGNLNPGTSTSTGILTLGNTWFRSASSSDFEVELNGTSAGSGHDQLVVNGTVELTGDLDITLGYSPAVGDSFTIIDNDGTDPVVGAFNGLSEGGLFSIGTDFFNITYEGGSGNDVVLTKVLVGVWDGGGADSNWTTAANWVGDVAPLANSKLIFPDSALQKTNVNDFAAGTSFGSILISGSNYSISGNQVDLNGSVTSLGSGNTFDLPIQLVASGGISSSSGTFNVGGAIDTNANNLSLGASSSTLIVSDVISGSGSVFTGGSGIVALSGNNTYTGETTVGGNTLAVRHNKALGAADNTEATGTRITDSNGRVQLENGVTVMDELLTSSPNINLNLYSTGTGAAGRSLTLTNGPETLTVAERVQITTPTCVRIQPTTD